MKARGTTLWIEDRTSDPSRKTPWGVCWHEYQPGSAARPKQRSRWFATEAEAVTFRDEVQRALAERVSDDTSTTMPSPRRAGTVAALTVPWLADVGRNREAATRKSYEDCVKGYIAPAAGHPRYPGLGEYMVDDRVLKPVLIANFLEGLADAGVSLSMRRRVHRTMSAFCTYARFVGKLEGAGNPCKDLGRRLRRADDVDEEKGANPFSPEEISHIFEVLNLREADYVAYFQFLLDVGVRPGEAAGLKWTAVDLDRARAKIELSWSPVAGKDKDPKTHEKRVVDLSRRVVERLRQWRNEQREEALRRGRPVPEYVFTSRRLARMFQTSGNVPRVFDRLMEACQLTGHRLYDFRHTFATSHLTRDWDRKLGWVSKQLGHKTPATTSEYYYAWRDNKATAGFADDITGWER